MWIQGGMLWLKPHLIFILSDFAFLVCFRCRSFSHSKHVQTCHTCFIYFLQSISHLYLLFVGLQVMLIMYYTLHLLIITPLICWTAGPTLCDQSLTSPLFSLLLLYMQMLLPLSYLAVSYYYYAMLYINLGLICSLTQYNL